MTDHYEEFRPAEIDERVEQLLQLDDVAFPSSDLEHDVRLTKHLELLFQKSRAADQVSLHNVEQRLFQRLKQTHHQSENSNITSISEYHTRYLKRDQKAMQQHSYRRSNRLVEVLIAVFFLAIVGSGLLVFLHIYQQNHQSTSPSITPTAVPAHSKETKQAIKPEATPTAAPERSCNNSAAAQPASPGTYVRKYDRIFKLDNQSGQIDWTFILPGGVKSSFSTDPLVVGNTVYVSSYSGSVFALDASRGEMLWSHQDPVYQLTVYQLAYPRSLQIDCGLLAFIGADNSVHVLDSTSGADVWHTDEINHASYGLTQTLVGAQGVIYYSSSADVKVHAFNILNGHELWNQTLSPSFKGFTHIANNMLYNDTRVLDTMDGRVLLDGTQISDSFIIQRIDSSIAYFSALSSTRTTTVTGAYDIDAHQTLWQSSLGGRVYESHGRVYIITTGGGFFVLDARTGHEFWEETLYWMLPQEFASQTLDIGNIIYVRDYYGIYGLSLDGQRLWNYKYPMTDNYPPGVISSYKISYGEPWLYTFTQDQSGFHLTAINPQSGQVAWKQDLSSSTDNDFANADPHYAKPLSELDAFGIITIAS